MRSARPLAHGLAVALALAAPIGLAVAEQPRPPPNKKLDRPNLSAARKLAAQALVKLEAARQAREVDGGHAARARQLLEEATAELRRALE